MNSPVKALPGLEIVQTDLSAIEDLAARLTAEQSFWVSGYFAGFARARGSGTTVVNHSVPGPQPRSAAEADSQQVVTIFYASETGNAAGLAKEYADRARGLGWCVEVHDLAGYKAKNLSKETTALFVCSTHGEGDPPEAAMTFFESLDGRKAPKLDTLRFAVLGLGDSTYEYFCAAARKLDARLAELGGQRLLGLAECDVDYEEPAEEWFLAVSEELATSDMPASVQEAGAVTQAAAPVISKSRPFSAPIIENIQLTGRGSNKETRHIEFAIDGSGIRYQPGDALGIHAENDPALVETLLETLGFSGTETVELKKRPYTLAEGLAQKLEITALTPRFLEAWAGFSGAAELKRLLDGANRTELHAFMSCNHIVDVARQYPVKGLSVAAFVESLRGLQPRLYSIASSQVALPDEVHIAVAVVRYDLNGTERLGVATGSLSERVAPDRTLPVFVQENENFRMPNDTDRPIIMIGAGTGAAPYRAFMQEIEETGRKNPAWLFFGEQHFRTDFLYQTEWQDWHRNGLLHRIDLAFSRDGDRKVYVQDRLKERSAEVYAWLEEGACIYVCGDAEGMAPGVNAALLSILQKERGCSAEAAEKYLRSLQGEGRYQRDVY
ncbi:assimilatory sulfite reductase (NADPH) flavoprotein subunit [Tepidicaulis sp. LMO-SS28]|uniref:assimilatory sulfite reductase (NADPH) flavoprotein subunit n=1 Tax=Tepidicaulis sp. LMO-SS28 TaxID=3447455 RepID=UPI003EDF04D8